MPSAELRESREILPDQWLQTYYAPSLAATTRPGQYVHVRLPPSPPPVTLQPIPINTFDRRNGAISIHFQVVDAATAWLAHMRASDVLEMDGPLGRPFQVDPRTRHVLLIAEGTAIRGLRALADEQVAANRQVTVVYSAPTAAAVYPSSLLPDEVEYVVATDDGSFGQRGSMLDVVLQFEAWADQAFASGAYDTLSALAQLARGRQLRLGVAALRKRQSKETLRRAWLQVAVEQGIGCAAGTCLGCVLMGADGPQRVCREGPVFASDDIAWELRWP